MAVLSNIPETNVKAVDIRDTLNANGGTVTDDLLTFFKAEANVHMWSLKKPVRNSENFPTGEWWKSDNCGLGAKSVSHPQQLAEAINGGLNGWTYRLPRGGTYGEPYRLGDFRGYAPNAARMVDSLMVPDKVQKGTELIIEAVVTQSGSDSVTVADLGLSGYYFGAYIVGSGSNCVKTAANPLSNLSASVSFDTSNFGEGDHKVYVFLSPGKIATQTTELVSSTYYTVPNTGIGKVNVTTSVVSGPSIHAYAAQTSYGLTNVEYEVFVTNLTQYSTVSGIIVKFRYPDKEYSDALIQGESMVQPSVEENIGASNSFHYKGTTSITQEMVSYGMNASNDKPIVYASCFVNGDRITHEKKYASELAFVVNPD